MDSYIDSSWKEKIKAIYYRLGNILCPAMNNERIYFNKYGLNHIFRKGRIPRSTREQIRRVGLLLYVEDVIRCAKIITEYREGNNQPLQRLSTARFWSLEKIIDNRKIIVVIRQINLGNKHFFSVIDEDLE